MGHLAHQVKTFISAGNSQVTNKKIPVPGPWRPVTNRSFCLANHRARHISVGAHGVAIAR